MRAAWSFACGAGSLNSATIDDAGPDKSMQTYAMGMSVGGFDPLGTTHSPTSSTGGKTREVIVFFNPGRFGHVPPERWIKLAEEAPGRQ